MWAVIAAAKLFSSRPSELLAIEDPVMALAFDLAAVERVAEEQESSSESRVRTISL